MAYFKKPEIPSQLNICIIGSRFPVLGKMAQESFLWPMAKGLAERGHQVTVIAWQNPQKKSEFKSGRIQAYYLGESPQSKRKDFPEMANQKFLELHHEKPFDIVHSLDDSGFVVGANRKKHGVTVTYDISATHMSEIFSIMAMSTENINSLISRGLAVVYKFLTTYLGQDRKLLNTADGVFVTTPYQKIALERYYLYPELKTFIVPYGSEYIDLSPREPSLELRHRLGLPAGGRCVITLTDMTEFEEVANLLKAFQSVAVKKPSSRLIIIGNGPLYKDLEFETLNLVLGSKVIFTGAVSNEELPDYLALADVYVNLSSRTSGFEPSTLEAMALEKVTIGSELSPISTIVEDARDGFLIRPADISSLTGLLTDLFTDKIEAQPIGQQARQKVLDLFDSDKMTNQMLDGFTKTLESHRRIPNDARPRAAFF